MKASIRELRSATSQIISAVERGDTVMITKRGNVCAQIVPVDTRPVEPQDDVFGLWKTNEKVKSVKHFIDEIRGEREL